MSRADLDARVLAWMQEDAWRRDDARFDELARALFAFQFEACPPYRRLCEARKVTPASLRDWRDVPAVPTGAFKEVELRCFPKQRELACFRTSGTSSGRRGELHLDTLALYEASLLSSIRHLLFPDFELSADRVGAPRERPQLAVLAPSAREAPDSSLSHMFQCALERFGSDESRFYVEAGGLRLDALERMLSRSQRPVALCGTAFAFVHLLESTARDFVLPAGSRILETGGFKGRSRELPRQELYAWMEARLGVPRSRIVNQYGMTELGSQFYDSVLAEPEAPRRKLGPPWTRVRLLDPTTDREVDPGEPGVVVVHDLANTGSVAAVMTADLGVRVEAQGREPGFEVLGREAGAEARGCSIAADLMLGG